MERRRLETIKKLLPSYTIDDALIVPRGTLPDQLRAEIEASSNVKFLLAGQRGMGKTTELKRLETILGEGNNFIIFVQFGSQSEINNPMLFEAMARNLMEMGVKEVDFGRATNKEFERFENWFADEEKEKTVGEGSKKEAGIGAKFSVLKAGGSIYHDKSETTTRTIRKAKKVGDLIEIFNSLVRNVEKLLDKQIVFIVDDIDKIQNAGSVENTFIHHSHLINKIDSPCVFTVPITYATSSMLRVGSLPYSEIYRVPAVELFYSDGSKNDGAFNFMKNVFKKRMDDDPIGDERLEVILKNSGGVLIDALRMVRGVCKRKFIDDGKDIEDLIKDEFQKLIDDYKFVFDRPELWKKLLKICETEDSGVIMTDEVLPELLYKMIVIEYREKELWFGLHPAARELYNQNQEAIKDAVKDI